MTRTCNLPWLFLFPKNYCIDCLIDCFANHRLSDYILWLVAYANAALSDWLPLGHSKFNLKPRLRRISVSKPLLAGSRFEIFPQRHHSRSVNFEIFGWMELKAPLHSRYTPIPCLRQFYQQNERQSEPSNTKIDFFSADNKTEYNARLSCYGPIQFFNSRILPLICQGTRYFVQLNPTLIIPGNTDSHQQAMNELLDAANLLLAPIKSLET